MSSTSRSSSPFHSSPATPESGQANDFMGDPTVAVAGWETSSGGAQTLSEIVDWVAKDVFGSQQQADVDGLLSLDDLLQEDAFAESSNFMDDSQPIQRDGAQNPSSASLTSLVQGPCKNDEVTATHTRLAVAKGHHSDVLYRPMNVARTARLVCAVKIQPSLGPQIARPAPAASRAQISTSLSNSAMSKAPEPVV
ncbi:hypothetical protein EXIGLDRAFT_766591 [Exidia glandulosa HHB12029]|uniref:Uncharacterized protein n=1 Tax=Exidia glandulosa HHB12029 TaxID=1314781 RepID=A0A165JKY5_EXIGL|nr:hypothetical protein EXIGLDRAFT_766591 [Exidia glandulosa HHB12029]